MYNLISLTGTFLPFQLPATNNNLTPKKKP